jgi:TetR/AcrR family transcriptional regulator, regulator of cefoperazone and chloramphenicol sensitivity
MSSRTVSKMQERGEATKQKIVEAALLVFGDAGYAGASARDIAKAAQVPLAAIPYHFGTKESLYKAVLREVVDRMKTALAPTILATQSVIGTTPEQAATALVKLQGDLLTTLVVAPEAKSWAKVLFREHMDPSDAYDVVYSDGGHQVIQLIAILIAQITSRKQDNEDVMIEALARFGEVLVFLVSKNAAIRLLNWKDFGSSEAAKVTNVISRIGMV